MAVEAGGALTLHCVRRQVVTRSCLLDIYAHTIYTLEIPVHPGLPLTSDGIVLCQLHGIPSRHCDGVTWPIEASIRGLESRGHGGRKVPAWPECTEQLIH